MYIRENGNLLTVLWVMKEWVDGMIIEYCWMLSGSGYAVLFCCFKELWGE